MSELTLKEARDHALRVMDRANVEAKQDRLPPAPAESPWRGERWEYLKVDIQAESDDDMIAAFTRLGAEGWQLCPAVRLVEPPPLIPGTRKVARTYAFTRRVPGGSDHA